MWNKTCFFGKNVSIKNKLDEPIKKVCFSDKEIYCKQKSIRASEFYQANATGYKPEITLEVMLIDYEEFVLDDDDLIYVHYNDKNYTVIRTYQTSEERIELTLQRGVLNADTKECC